MRKQNTTYSAKSKYGSRKVAVDGEKFDSIKEYHRYNELQLLERAGKIQNLKRQVPYLLIPTQYDENHKLLERSTVYRADFTYTDMETGEIVVEDTKGFRTDTYTLKRKLMLYQFGIRIKET